MYDMSCGEAYGKKGCRCPKCLLYQRAQHLRQEYGITLEDYDTLLDAQEGRCGGCGRTLDSIKHKKNKNYFCVDHCHDTGAIRGLTCSKCNLAVGHFDHDPDRIQSAIAYLEAHAAEIPGADPILPVPIFPRHWVPLSEGEHYGLKRIGAGGSGTTISMPGLLRR